MKFPKQIQMTIIATTLLITGFGVSFAADFSDYPYQSYDVAICQGYFAVHRDRFSPDAEAKQAYDQAEKILFRVNEEMMGREAAIQMGRVSFSILSHMLEFGSDVEKFESMELPISTRLLAPEVKNYEEVCFDAIDRALKIFGAS